MITKRTTLLAALAAVASLTGMSGGALARDTYPNHELKIIVNYASGGAVDRTARSMQKYLPDAIKQSVVVENHKGAGGKIGLQKFLGADPDGYTVLTAFAPGTTLVKYKDPSVFTLDDLAIINVQWSDPVILIARKDTGWTTLSDMIVDVRANPGKYAFGSSGKGAAGPVLSNVLFEKLGLDIKVVPYKGGGKTRAAFQGGHVQLTAAGAGGAKSVQEDAVVLGAFWDGPVSGWPDAKPFNELLKPYNITVPNGGSYRFHAVHRSLRDRHPKRWAKLVDAFRKVTTEHEGLKAFAAKTGTGNEWLGPEKSDALIRKVDADFTRILKDSES